MAGSLKLPDFGSKWKPWWVSKARSRMKDYKKNLYGCKVQIRYLITRVKLFGIIGLTECSVCTEQEAMKMLLNSEQTSSCNFTEDWGKKKYLDLFISLIWAASWQNSTKWHVRPAQTQMPRLIWIFTGRTCHFVSFVLRRLTLTLL